MAFQSAVPLSLRGHADVDTRVPSTRPEPAPDLIDRLERLYAADPALAAALARARALRGEMPGDRPGSAAAMAGMAAASEAGRAAPAALARQAAGFLAKSDGPQVAVLEMGGWDSHANLGACRAWGASAANRPQRSISHRLFAP